MKVRYNVEQAMGRRSQVRNGERIGYRRLVWPGKKSYKQWDEARGEICTYWEPYWCTHFQYRENELVWWDDEIDWLGDLDGEEFKG